MNTVNNAANLSRDRGTNLAAAERPPVDIFCGMTDIFKEDIAQRKCGDTLFHHLRYTYLWNVGLLLKTQESGKVVNGDQILTYTAFLHQTLPVNSQVFPVLRHMWLYCCPLTVVARSQREKKKKKGNPPLAYAHVMAHGPLIHSEETPSVTFSLQALLQAKTIKANRVQMFEPLLPTLQRLTHSYPYP